MVINYGEVWGATKLENRGSKTFCPPPLPQDRVKLFVPPPSPSKGWDFFLFYIFLTLVYDNG